LEASWLALVWRLPSGSSTPRVSIWRALKRLGAASLTPGAALLPFREDLLEQIGWIADEIDQMGGDAWVLPVTELTEIEESSVRSQINAERDVEYQELADEARAARNEGAGDREIGTLRSRLERIRARDHYGAPRGPRAIRAVDKVR
jgi:hypothetical protein